MFFQHLLLIDQIYACVLFGNIASAGLVCPFLPLTTSYKVARVDHPFTISWLTAITILENTLLPSLRQFYEWHRNS